MSFKFNESVLNENNGYGGRVGTVASAEPSFGVSPFIHGGTPKKANLIDGKLGEVIEICMTVSNRLKDYIAMNNFLVDIAQDNIKTRNTELQKLLQVVNQIYQLQPTGNNFIVFMKLVVWLLEETLCKGHELKEQNVNQSLQKIQDTALRLGPFFYAFIAYVDTTAKSLSQINDENINDIKKLPTQIKNKLDKLNEGKGVEQHKRLNTKLLDEYNAGLMQMLTRTRMLLEGLIKTVIDEKKRFKEDHLTDLQNSIVQSVLSSVQVALRVYDTQMQLINDEKSLTKRFGDQTQINAWRKKWDSFSIWRNTIDTWFIMDLAGTETLQSIRTAYCMITRPETGSTDTKTLDDDLLFYRRFSKILCLVETSQPRLNPKQKQYYGAIMEIVRFCSEESFEIYRTNVQLLLQVFVTLLSTIFCEKRIPPNQEVITSIHESLQSVLPAGIQKIQTHMQELKRTLDTHGESVSARHKRDVYILLHTSTKMNKYRESKEIEEDPTYNITYETLTRYINLNTTFASTICEHYNHMCTQKGDDAVKMTIGNHVKTLLDKFLGTNGKLMQRQNETAQQYNNTTTQQKQGKKRKWSLSFW